MGWIPVRRRPQNMSHQARRWNLRGEYPGGEIDLEHRRSVRTPFYSDPLRPKLDKEGRHGSSRCSHHCRLCIAWHTRASREWLQTRPRPPNRWTTCFFENNDRWKLVLSFVWASSSRSV